MFYLNQLANEINNRVLGEHRTSGYLSQAYPSQIDDFLWPSSRWLAIMKMIYTCYVITYHVSDCRWRIHFICSTLFKCTVLNKRRKARLNLRNNKKNLTGCWLFVSVDDQQLNYDESFAVLKLRNVICLKIKRLIIYHLCFSSSSVASTYSDMIKDYGFIIFLFCTSIIHSPLLFIYHQGYWLHDFNSQLYF